MESPRFDLAASADDPHPEVRAFWEVARERARLVSDISIYFGATPLGTVPPPTWSFGDTPAESDEFAHRVVREGSFRDCTPVSLFEQTDAPRPEKGNLSILCDGQGLPVALLVTSDVVEEHMDGTSMLCEAMTVLHPR